MGQMKRKILVVLGLVAFLGVGLTGYATADTDATVNATVTAQQVAMSVTESLVEYGVLNIGDTDQVPNPVSFDADNDGNVPVDFTIRGFNTADWTLAGTTGADQYIHRFSTDGGSGFTALTTSTQTLSSVAVSGSQTVHLNLDMPDSTAATATQNADVKVLATAS